MWGGCDEHTERTDTCNIRYLVHALYGRSDNMSFVANAWKALARIDDEFVEFGRMPQRDEFWDDGISEEPDTAGGH